MRTGMNLDPRSTVALRGLRCLTTMAAVVAIVACTDGSAPEEPAAIDPPPGAETPPPTPPPTSPPAAPSAAPLATDSSADIHEAYAALLKDAITDAGLVRYEKVAGHEDALDRVVRWYGTAPLPTEPSERLARWCNAYNANVLRLALRASRKPGFVNVEKVPGFFDRQTIRVGGETLTLNGLENDRVRPVGDARIHAALVCAAMSCPPLRDEPYEAARLDAQLDDQCRRWVNDKAEFRVADGKLGISMILNWYGDDFRTPRYGNPTGFVLAYVNPGSAVSRYIANTDPPVVEWLPYDWTLNRAGRE